jgi:hypothetical protein
MASIMKIQGQRVPRIYSAKFYFFKYLTYAPTNRYYNMYPLVFSLGKVPKLKGQSSLSDSGSGGGDSLFRGLDFHYLPIPMRLHLLNELRSISPDLYQSPVAFAKYFLKFMWKVRKYRPARVCYRHYKLKNIRGGKIIKIDLNDWDTIIQQPKVEKFVTASLGIYSPERVWKESLKEIRKSGRD